MEVKWTPGPWEFDTARIDTEGDGRVLTGEVRDAKNLVVVEFSNSECSELIYEDDGVGGGTMLDVQQIANAYLIAAAPDLYEALEKALPAMEYLHAMTRGGPKKSDALANLNAAKAALAKARGEK